MLKLAAVALLIGAFVNPDGQKSQADVVAFEAATGHLLAMDHTFISVFGWNASSDSYTREQWDVAGGRVPMVDWPVRLADGSCALPGDIQGGVYDDQLIEQGEAWAGLGATIIVAWDHEFNVAGNACGSFYDAASYAATYRYIVGVMREAGATNVLWSFNPTIGLFANDGWKAWYPGDDVIDYISADGYNSSQNPRAFGGNGWSGFCAIEQKPLGINETGAVSGTPANLWIASMRVTLGGGPNSSSSGLICPNVQYVLWFDAQGGAQDYRFDADGLTAWGNFEGGAR